MNCTIVTAYYNLNKKKHSTDNYLKWIKNYMNIIDAPLVVFTDCEDIGNYILKLRNNKLNITKIIILKITDLHCYNYIDYWKKDYDRDHEKYHDPLLYIIWNEKTMFMYKAYQKNYFNTAYFAWTDIGMVRDNKLIDILKNNNLCFPNLKKIEKIKKDRVYLLEVEKFKKHELEIDKFPTEIFRYEMGRCGGGVILCNNIILERWKSEYYKMLEEFIKNDYIADKDQNIMNNIYLRYKNELIELVEPINSPIDKWFYMLYFMCI